MSRAHYLKHLALSMGTRLAMIGLRLLRKCAAGADSRTQ